MNTISSRYYKSVEEIKTKLNLGVYTCMKDYNENKIVKILEQTLGKGFLR